MPADSSTAAEERAREAVGDCYVDGCDHNCGVAWHAAYENYRALAEGRGK